MTDSIIERMADTLEELEGQLDDLLRNAEYATYEGRSEDYRRLRKQFLDRFQAEYWPMYKQLWDASSIEEFQPEFMLEQKMKKIVRAGLRMDAMSGSDPARHTQLEAKVEALEAIVCVLLKERAMIKAAQGEE